MGQDGEGQVFDPAWRRRLRVSADHHCRCDRRVAGGEDRLSVRGLQRRGPWFFRATKRGRPPRRGAVASLGGTLPEGSLRQPVGLFRWAANCPYDAGLGLCPGREIALSLSNTVLDTRFRSALGRMADSGRLQTYTAPVDPHLEVAGLVTKLHRGGAALV